MLQDRLDTMDFLETMAGMMTGEVDMIKTNNFSINAIMRDDYATPQLESDIDNALQNIARNRLGI